MPPKKKTDVVEKKPAADGKPAPLYLIFGDEYKATEEAKALVAKFCPESNRDFGLEEIDGRCNNTEEALQAIRRCREGLQTLGFLSGPKVIWFRDVSFLADNQVGRVADVKDATMKIIADIEAGGAGGNILIISASKVDGRFEFYRACKKVGQLKEFEISEKAYLSSQQAAEFARDIFRKAGLTIYEDAMDAFIGKVGYDSRQIVQEVNKLTVYIGDRKEVAEKDIHEIVSPTRETAMWDLADAFGHRDLPGSIRVLRQLIFQGESAMGLIFGLESRVRDLIFYRECLERKWLTVSGDGKWTKAEWSHEAEVEQVMSGMAKDPRKVHPFRAAILAKQARLFSLRELMDIHEAVLSAHERMVSSGMPADLILEFLLLKLLGRSSASVVYSNAI